MVMTADEKKRFEIMEDRITDIDSKVDEIRNALLGDSMGTSNGLINDFKEYKERVKKLEAYNREFEKTKLKFIWLAMGAGLAAGFTIEKIWALILKILA